MNLLPNYILLNKIISRLSAIRNNIYRFLPPKQFNKLRTKNITRIYNQHYLNKVLKDTLGDFSDYDITGDGKDELLRNADKILMQYFDILGSGEVKLEPLNWHTDFKSGYSWPRGKFYRDYVKVDLTNDSDVKVPWELSRCHHFLLLGQAYLVTKNEIYTQKFIQHVSDWINENPLMRSINWESAMVVSIRAVNWLYALNMFVGSPLINDAFIRKISLSLYDHGWFIYRNLEKGFPYSDNHYASNIAGLLFLGSFFKDIPEGKRWFNFALKEFYSEVRVQVMPSGVHFELSTSYHRLMTEFFFYSYLHLKRNNINIPSDIRHRIEKMFDFVLFYIKPDGNSPIIGDEDNGRFLPFDKYEKPDHRYLLSLAAIEFKKPLYKKYSIGHIPESLFLFEEKSKEIFDSIPDTSKTLDSKSFSDAGFYILRHLDHYMFINNSGVSRYPDHIKSGRFHTHADLLSFEFALGKSTFIIDAGTYAYTSSQSERNHFRSTKVHNTLTVDDCDQHILDKNNAFKLHQLAYPVENVFENGEFEDKFFGSHDGYCKLPEPILHTRQILFNKKELIYNVRDELKGEGVHNVKWHFHFNSGLEVESDNDKCLKLLDRNNNVNIELLFSAKFKLDFILGEDYISSSYGFKRRTKTLNISARINCPDYLHFQIKQI